ncbi:hypothetical protein [Variovorax sp. HJSM1_2]|uniref:hypothetical protein n=1 Tax=Variovorax sp. HJSM1_2 TaxID=3366263 RepID=UPI003BD1B514
MPLPQNLRRAVLIFLAVIVLAASWFTPVTDRARTEVEGGLQRALTVFAAARALGAVVSVAQHTQVEVSAVGVVGVALAPGQILQPLDHLLDQFAEVMLFASVSFGVQLLLLKIGTHWVVSTLVTVAVVGMVLARWRDANSASRWLQPLVVVLLVIRFAVPVSAIGNEALYRWFMADELHQELSTLQTPSTESVLKEPLADRAMSSLARLKEWASKFSDPKSQYEDILKSATGWSNAIVKLIGYFVAQTVLFPIAFLGLIWVLARVGVRAVLPVTTS